MRGGDDEALRVYLVYHTSHIVPTAVPRISRSSNEEGLHDIDDAICDDAKLLGCYSSRARAEDRVERSRELPGFRDQPDAFVISEYVVDKDEWAEGFQLM